MMRLFKLSTLFLLFPFGLLAQEVSNVRSEVKKIITEKFPSTRFLDFEYEITSAGDYDSKLYNELYEKGEIRI